MTLDRFDPGRDQAGAPGRVPSALLPGDVLVPCLFSTQTETSSDAVVQSEEELHHCFKVSVTPADGRLVSVYCKFCTYAYLYFTAVLSFHATFCLYSTAREISYSYLHLTALVTRYFTSEDFSYRTYAELMKYVVKSVNGSVTRGGSTMM